MTYKFFLKKKFILKVKPLLKDNVECEIEHFILLLFWGLDVDQ